MTENKESKCQKVHRNNLLATTNEQMPIRCLLENLNDWHLMLNKSSVQLRVIIGVWEVDECGSPITILCKHVKHGNLECRSFRIVSSCDLRIFRLAKSLEMRFFWGLGGGYFRQASQLPSFTSTEVKPYSAYLVLFPKVTFPCFLPSFQLAFLQRKC